MSDQRDLELQQVNPQWSRRSLRLPGGLRTVRGAAFEDGAVHCLLVLERGTHRRGSDLLFVRLADDRAELVCELGGIARDIAVGDCEPLDFVALDVTDHPGALRVIVGECEEEFSTEVVLSEKAIFGGFDMHHCDEVDWVSFVDDQSGAAWVGRRVEESWKTGCIARAPRMGPQSRLLPLSDEHAFVALVVAEKGVTVGDLINVDTIRASSEEELAARVRAHQVASAEKWVVLAYVEGERTPGHLKVARTYNFHTPALEFGSDGDLVVTTMHALDPPDFTRFEIRRNTLGEEGNWTSDLVAVEERFVPLHLSSITDGETRALFCLCVDPHADSTRLMPKLYPTSIDAPPEELPVTSYNDEVAAKYGQPGCAFFDLEGRVNVLVPEKGPSSSCLHWYRREAF